MPPWDNYRDRFKQRPETLDAYADVWQRVPEAQVCFGGWVGFMQAANAEPGWVANRPERVHLAEEIMRSGGYVIGPTTERGARRWVKVERRARFATLHLFGRTISV
jgi:hypothetical protein